ncbi:hypothetical protein TIFTF001_013758 [Ficus carica]|uniref:F-box protein n=1 Tax=Ficus carica TaxID=3494 RepID=A0AA88D6C1_FICCA|nr:hypothetical protein TIFTF001_013758 [Ficus carica]
MLFHDGFRKLCSAPCFCRIFHDGFLKNGHGSSVVESTFCSSAFFSVKYLLKYRVVSSHWLRLVDGPPFAIDHEKNSKPKSILCDGNNIFFLDLQDRRASMGGRVPLNRSNIEILGSSRGILAVMADSHKLFLWNAATRFFQKIWCRNVVIPQDLNQISFAFYAFGCGEEQLKLLRTVQFLNGQGDVFSRIEAYGVETKIWNHYEMSFSYFISMKTPYGIVLDQSAH